MPRGIKAASIPDREDRVLGNKTYLLVTGQRVDACFADNGLVRCTYWTENGGKHYRRVTVERDEFLSKVDQGFLKEVEKKNDQSQPQKQTR